MKFKIVLVFVMLLAIVGLTVYNAQSGAGSVATKSLFKGSTNFLDLNYETMIANLQSKREGVYLISFYSVDTEEVIKVLDTVLEETKRKAHYIDVESTSYTTEMRDVVSTILDNNGVVDQSLPILLVIDQQESLRIHGANVGGKKLQGRALSETESQFLKNEYKNLFD